MHRRWSGLIFRPSPRNNALVVLCTVVAVTTLAVRLRGTSDIANLVAYPDSSGVVQTFTKNGNIDIASAATCSIRANDPRCE